MKLLPNNKVSRKQFDKILELYDQYGFEPNFDKFKQLATAVDDNGEVVGFAATRTILEGMLYTDKNISNRKRVEVLKLLMSQVGTITDYNDLHVFNGDSNFIRILERHFDFKKRHQALFKRL